MIECHTVKVSLPLKRKFVVSRGEAEIKTNLLTVMNNRYSGEASGSVYYGPSVDEIEQDLRKGIERIARKKSFDVEDLEEISTYDINPIARSALVAMVLNYISGEQNRYPWEVLGIGSPVGIKSSITIGVGKPDEVIEQIKASEHPIVKLKLGSEYDPEIVVALKDIADKDIRVDANGAWSCEKAQEMIHFLSEAGVTVIEQPTEIAHIEEWPHLKPKKADVELIVDEGLETYEDYEKVSEHVDGVNIKMEKSGGIVEGSRIAQKAREDGKKVMLGCMVESSVGIAQSVYMSAMADYHDLDGPQLLNEDIASGITYRKNTIEVDREIIGGPKLKRDVIEKYIQD